jgi:hypothetical protein
MMGLVFFRVIEFFSGVFENIVGGMFSTLIFCFVL